VTIQQYFGETRRTDPASRNRRAMLEKVWAIWITGILQPSLPHDILLDLGLNERPAMVARTLDLYVQRPDLAEHVQAPGTRLVDVFDRLDRALLILGAPGAGKTTLLLTLARHLLIRAAQDLEHPIPVIFPLSSWAQRRRPLADWLVEALSEQYQVPRKTGQTWVEADQILPLLDGLDEVALEHRAACVEAINTFRQDHGLLPLVVCSRVADYEALGTHLQLQGALVVQPLTRDQVDAFMAQVGPPLAAVRQALQDDPMLWDLLDTPLMLTIVTLTYVGQPIAALDAGETPEVRRRHLFAAYIERMFQRRSIPTRYTRPQIERWLAWLAWQLTQHSQTVFYLERMQPDWLPQRQRWVPRQGVSLVASLGGGLVGGLLDEALGYKPVLGLLGALAGGLGGYAKEIMPIETLHWSWSRFFSELLRPSGRRLVGGLRDGLVGGLLGGLVGWLGFVRVYEHGGDLFSGLVLGLGIWLFIILLGGLGGALGTGLGSGLLWLAERQSHWLGGMTPSLFFWILLLLEYGLLVGLSYQLRVGLVAGLSGGEIVTKTTPNEGIYRSARMAVLSGLGAGLFGGLVGVLGFALVLRGSAELVVWLGFMLLVGLPFCLSTGLKYGGRACLQHLILRLLLVHNDSASWHYVEFLDYAAERLFLRKVGGGYSFLHRLLQDYFATRYTTPGGDSGSVAS
jgi:eukaryotic-like serine/threonine-protein kinase